MNNDQPDVANGLPPPPAQDPSPAPASAIPSQLLLVCGTATGTLDMATGRITHNGQHVTAPEFERLGGKSSAKKWKSSIRVDSASGTPLGDWLQEHGLDLRNNQIHRVNTPTRTASVRSAPRQQGGALPYLKLPHMHHFHVGALQGDASGPPLPRAMPPRPSQHSSNLVVNLHTTHPDYLHSMAAASAEAPLRGMLPFAPGIPHDRASYPTGRAPRPWPSVQDKAQWAGAVQAHIQGAPEGDEVWAQLGMEEPCMWPDGTTPVDLRRLALAVQGAGGFSAVEQHGLWSALCASQLGVDPVAFPGAPRQARSLYVHLLLGMEQGMEQGGHVGGVGGGSEVVLDDDEDDPFAVE